MSDEYRLDYGTHATPEDGRCAMEWVAHLAGEPHSDSPLCVSPVLRAVCITLNDGLADGPRQGLRPYLARTIGTSLDGQDPIRGWRALDWLIRHYGPTWLDVAGLPGAARGLPELDRVQDLPSLQWALHRLGTAQAEVRAARRGLYRLPRPAGWMSSTVTGVLVREAAWGCTGAAAWSAVRLTIEDPRADRARAAIQAIAAHSAAIQVARHRAEHGRGPLRDLTRGALSATLESLTDSALGLLGRMLPTEYLPLPAPVGAPAAAPG